MTAAHDVDYFEVFAALRDLLAADRLGAYGSAEVLADRLHQEGFLPYRPPTFAMEVALETLHVDGEVLT